jgi:hypothetical protein
LEDAADDLFFDEVANCDAVIVSAQIKFFLIVVYVFDWMAVGRVAVYQIGIFFSQSKESNSCIIATHAEDLSTL